MSQTTRASSPAATRPNVRARPSDERISWATWRLAWVIVLGAFASSLDASLVNIGLARIGADLHVGLATAQWIAGGYLLALALALPVAGWLSRRVGVGRLWLSALAGFTVASGLCAIAPTIAALIGMRVLQGLAGGLLIPAGQTLIGQAVGPGRLGRVMATLGVAVTVGPAIGPVIGGLLLNEITWRWLFAINLPVGALGLLLGLRYVPHDRQRATEPLDWRALGLISVGLPSILYGLMTLADQRASSAMPAAALIAGTGALAAFVRRSRRSQLPLIDLTLLRRPAFAAAAVCSGLSGVLLFGSGLLLPLYLQLGRQVSVVDTGIALLGLAVPTAVALPLAGRLVDRHGSGPVSVLATATTIPFAVLPLDTGEMVVQGLLASLGVAIALAVVPPSVAAFKAASFDQLADAAAVISIAQRLGGALGSALITVVLVDAGVDAAFWALAISCLAAVAAAIWLARTSREPRTE